MSFKSRSQEIIDATQIDPPENNEARIGGLFKDIGAVTETVDTIADLRAFDTSGLTEGYAVGVKSHSTAGVNKRLGEGAFVWRTTPLFSIDNAGGYTAGEKLITVTALTEGLAADQNYGVEVIFESGVTGTVVGDEGTINPNPPNYQRAYGEGDTQIRIQLNGTVADNERAFYADDNGVFIRPTVGSLGNWERVRENGYVTPDMYGAIPNNSPYDGAINDAAVPLQNCFDSLFDVYIPGSSYYTSQTLYVRRNKEYRHQGRQRAYSGFQPSRRERLAYGKMFGVIYITTNIRVIECWGSCAYTGNLDTTQVTGHDKAAFAALAGYRISGKFDITVQGDIEQLEADTNNINLGTVGFLVDAQTVPSSDGSFSDAGWFSDCDVSVRAYGCNNVIEVTPISGSIDTFVNTSRFRANADACKRLYDVQQNMGLTQFEGVLQNRFRDLLPNDWTDSEKNAYACSKIVNTTGGYYDVWIWDPDGRVEHEFTSDAGGFDGDGVTFGPLTKRQLQGNSGFYGKEAQTVFYNKVTAPEMEIEEPRSVDRDDGVKRIGVYRRKVIHVSSAMILASNTTPIPVIESSDRAGEVYPVRIYCTNWAGTVDYSSYTTLRVDSQYGADWGSIDLSNLPDEARLVYNVEIAQKSGQLSTGNINLFTSTGNPTGGDKSFDLVIEWQQLSKF